VLVWFISKFLWNPIIQMMEDRSNRIADGLAAAERGQHDLELAEKGATERLREAKQDAMEIVAAAHKQANQIIEDSKQKALLEGERKLEIARAEIEQESHRAKENLRTQVVQLALAGAEKILEREIDSAAHDEFLNKMVKAL
jgi:F-type H+-transporting ATPase subunit b